MSDVRSVNSYSERSSEDDDEPTPGIPSMHSAAGAFRGDRVDASSVSESYFQQGQGTLQGAGIGRSFDQFDVESDRLDEDFDKPMTAEEAKLFKEIEEEQRIDRQLKEDVNTRAALFTTPLLMAASSEVLTSGSTEGSFFPPTETTPEPRKPSKAYARHNSGGSSSYSDENEEITDEDLQFRSKKVAPAPPEQPFPDYTDPFLDNDTDRKDRRDRVEKRRKMNLAVGGLCIIAIVAVVLGVTLTRGNNERSAPVTPSPSSFPTVTPSPAITSNPAGSPTTRVPTETPLIRPRTREPSQQPITRSPSPTDAEITNLPTAIPTNTPTPAPTNPPIPFTLRPTNPPTPAPAGQSNAPVVVTTVPTPFTLSPIPAPPTIAPTIVTPTGAPSFEPSLTDEETQRRAQITSLVIGISGVLVLLDSQSPQFRAYQWILNGDPLQLMATDRPQIIQRYVLATLFYATQGETSWLTCGPPEGSTPCDSQLKRFLSGAPECMWLGITCGSLQLIETINIRENGLMGKLPPEIAELTRLSTFSLSRNELFGTIPTALKALSRLRFLLLNQNDLTGTIPEFLGELSSIWYLHLGGNRFEGTIPPSIFTPALQHFDVGDNKLIGTIPEELYTVSQDMLNIDMSQNSLSGTIPVGLGSFPTLNSLTIFNNTFSGTLPGQIVSDTLKTLDVGRNMLTGTLPDEVYMFGSSLTFINFGVNLFAGTISPRFGDLTKLQTLVFYFTDVTGTIPFELSRLTNLEILHFAGTLLQGIMPAEICSLREGSLQVLTANCFGQVPVVNCSCCTYCYREGDDAGRLIG